MRRGMGRGETVLLVKRDVVLCALFHWGNGKAVLPQKTKKARNLAVSSLFCGGLEGDRTLDLTDANRTLSQLSYEPVCLALQGDPPPEATNIIP